MPSKISAPRKLQFTSPALMSRRFTTEVSSGAPSAPSTFFFRRHRLQRPTSLLACQACNFATPFIVYRLARVFPNVSIIRTIKYASRLCVYGLRSVSYSAMNTVSSIDPCSTSCAIRRSAVTLAVLEIGWLQFLFSTFTRDKYRGWWMHDNYITSFAPDVGLALCPILLFYIELPGGAIPDYWGTIIISNTLDGAGATVRKTVANGEYFGPRTWKWYLWECKRPLYSEFEDKGHGQNREWIHVGKKF